MPIIVLERPVSLPARELERVLAGGLPGYRWRVGDDPEIALVSLDRPNTILGMAGADLIMMAVELNQRPLPLEAGAPAHHCHIGLSEPSTDNREVAKRMAVLAAAVLLDGQAGFAQIAPGGAWFTPGELAVGKQRILSSPDKDSIDDFLLSHGQAAPTAASAGAGPESPMPGDAYPPAPDEMFDDYRRIRIPDRPKPDPIPPRPASRQQPQAGLFRRSPGLFGRRKT